MSRQKQSLARHNPMRRNIASLAARMMAEDGISDYGFAKRKAAKQLGAPDSEALPNNAEIEAELRAYQAIYQGEEQPATLAALRRTALSAMQLLEPFSPYLKGSVLSGTAGRYATIELQVYAESAKDVELFLINHQIDYAHRPTRRQNDGVEAILEFDWDEVPVALEVSYRLAERAQRRNPHSGRTEERASLAAVAALCEEEER